MAKITIEDILETIRPDKWELVSKEYKNLKDVLHFRCAEGHDVYAPFEKIRKERSCPACKDNIYKDPNSVIVPKTKNKRTLALDQSTNVSAWAIFDGQTLVKYGVFIAKGKDTAHRLVAIKDWFLSMVELWQPDRVAIEDIQLQNFGQGGIKSYNNATGIQTFKVLAQLQGLLITLATENKLPIKLAPTPSWRSHCKVKGKSRVDKKRSIQLLVKEWFDITVTDDEAEAIGIGRYAVERLFNEREMIEF